MIIISNIFIVSVIVSIISIDILSSTKKEIRCLLIKCMFAFSIVTWFSVLTISINYLFQFSYLKELQSPFSIISTNSNYFSCNALLLVDSFLICVLWKWRIFPNLVNDTNVRSCVWRLKVLASRVTHYYLLFWAYLQNIYVNSSWGVKCKLQVHHYQ